MTDAVLLSVEEIKALSREFETASPGEVLQWAAQTFGSRAAFGTSFQGAGLVAIHHAENDLQVIGDFLSYDPYGIMYRKDDPELADLVNRVFREMAESRYLGYTYDRWFLKKLPGGVTLNLPMSAQLNEIFRALGAPD